MSVCMQCGITHDCRGVEQLRKSIVAKARREAFEEAAKEAEKPRTMFLTKGDVLDGMMSDDHPIIKARAQMRKEVAAAIRALAHPAEEAPPIAEPVKSQEKRLCCYVIDQSDDGVFQAFCKLDQGHAGEHSEAEPRKEK